MNILDAIIAWLSTALTALMIFVAALLPHPAPSTAVAPEAVATSTTAVATTTVKAVAKPVTTPAAKKPVTTNGLAAPAPAALGAQDAGTRGPLAGQVSLPPIVPTKSQEQINVETRAALVNILCLTKTGIHGVSGSGVIIDSRGVILTNAHIGQYFLLRDYLTPGNVECTVRIGSPAERRYTAKLLYLPPLWVADNAAQLKASVATGTGEHDYAFLMLTGTTDPSATLPSSFPHLVMENSYPDVGDEMLLASYPAGFLSGELIEKSLYASSAVAYTTRLFSFDDSQRVDLFSIGGTVLSQAGSSGGAVVRLTNGKLAGLIATATTGESTGERDLRAVTLSHINTSLGVQGQGGITALLTGNLYPKITTFETSIAPLERAVLIKALSGN
ncbi:serine protease [Candidatus Kaiserbacteria bacterium]|nr:serine protease [Candidatus Kaiserbacteria bacterium]